MAGQSIASQIEAAYRSVGVEVGDGEFTVTLIEPGAGQVNPWDAPGGADTEHAGIPALVGTIPDEWIDGTLIRADDEMIKIAGTAPAIEQDWLVRMNGLPYTIQTIKKLNPGGAVLQYTLILRR